MDKRTEFILKIGLAFSFLYPPVAALRDPLAWIGYFPYFMRDLFGNDLLLLYAFGGIEIALALWLLFGRNAFIPAVLMAAMLLAIVVFNVGAMDIVFRDLTILALAFALAMVSYGHDRYAGATRGGGA